MSASTSDVDVPESFDDLLEKIHVPNFSPVEPPAVNDPEVLEWNGIMQSILGRLREQVRSQRLKTDGAALVIARVAPLSSKDIWVHEDTRDDALSVLSKLDVDGQIIRVVLEKHIKPIFQANPHPFIQTSTGRALPRGAGGAMAAQDQYNEQPWKGYPSVDGTVSWCISRTTSSSFESLWHLIIPPVITFLDDYKAAYKLKGVRLVSAMLDNVPPDVLRKTGVGNLLSTSLSTAMTFLHDRSTADLIRETVPAIGSLINMTTDPDSEERFDRLCYLVGEGIIGGIWVYARHEESDVIEASTDVLPEVVHALGIGTARYLNGLIPQCTFLIAPNDTRPEPATTNLSALKALIAIMEECQPRLNRFKGSIFGTAGECWMSARKRLTRQKDIKAFKDHITKVYALLLEVCPSMKSEYDRCLSVLPDDFGQVMSS